MARELRWLAPLALWLAASVAAAADDALLEGDLGRWLDGVAPKLGDTLSRHPRFQGETLRLAVVTPGADEGRSNQLAQAIERRLRQQLLEAPDLRLAVARPRQNCEPPRPISYLVRVELTEGAGRDARVAIGVVDVIESVWVSGISYQWHGRLSAAERAALAAPVSLADPGSAGSPIPLDDAPGVAQAIEAGLACTLPRDLGGGLFVATPDLPALARVALALQADLSYRALAAITPDRTQAHWLLSLEADEAGAGVGEIALTLTDAEGGSRQRLAAVFVSGLTTDAGAGPPPAVAVRPAPEAAATPALLSALQMHPAPSQGVCDATKARVNTCVDVGFELREPAYLFVLSTRGHHIVDAPCDGELRPQTPGVRRYRLRVPPGTYALDTGAGGPDAGFYVLAARDRAVAQRLRDLLARTPGVCPATGPSRSDGAESAAGPWLARLARVLEREGDRVSWRAMQMAHDTGGVVAL